MDKITKRLTLIKQLILLEEFEQIPIQIEKIKGVFTETDFIVDLEKNINSKLYLKVIEAINEFNSSKSRIKLYEDSELTVLKLELKGLEIEVDNKNNELIEIEKLIHNFGLRQNKELGEIIQKILRFRKEKLKTQKDIGSAKRKEYEEAEFEYEEFNNQYENSKSEKLFELNEEQKNELKKLYRQASKLCHPDIVPESFKSQAEEIFKSLKKAYEENDIEKVREILFSLEKGEYILSKSDTINEKALLKSEISKLRNILNEIINKINELKSTDTYKTIIQTDNLDYYFEKTKKSLLEELKYLQEDE